MAESLRADPLQLEPVIELLAELDWVSRLDEGGDARHVLLCDPAVTPARAADRAHAARARRRVGGLPRARPASTG